MGKFVRFKNSSSNRNHALARQDQRQDIADPQFNSTFRDSDESLAGFESNIDKWITFVSFCRWHPDLWWDMITPEKGGITLDLDQRVYLRCMARFFSTYAVFPRGYGKTMLEVMSMIHMAIFYPNMDISMTAQTKENAVSILQDKWNEIVRFYPMILNEVEGKPRFARDSAVINFKSGGRIDILANSQSSKGQRRKRLMIEESALLDDATFQDALKPVVNVPRRTVGKQSLIDPHELNGQINFLTTSGFRGTSEFERSVAMVKEMIELKGSMVIGADYNLACHFGRSNRADVEAIRDDPTTSPTFFAQNYLSRWVGATDGALVNIGKVYALRSLSKAEFANDGKHEYILSMDVARSESLNNNRSVIVVLKIIRNKVGRIVNVQLVNIIDVPPDLTYEAQTVILKKAKAKYNPRLVVVDGNGLGSGIIDECIKETFDPNTGESLGCWKTVNTDAEPEVGDAEEILYDIKSSGINSEIIINFIDYVESGKLQLLERRSDKFIDSTDTDKYEKEYVPFAQTDSFIEEIANLKLKQTSHARFTVERVTRKIDKDKYSAVAYGLYVIAKVIGDEIEENPDEEVTDYLVIN